MVQRAGSGETRTIEQLHRDYEIEKGLAAKLRCGSRRERALLYSSVYEEYFQRVPLAPQLVRKSFPGLQEAAVSRQMGFLRRFLNRETVFLEVGPGDCSLSIEVSRLVKKVFSVDVAAGISRGVTLPDNCRLLITDGSSVPVDKNSVNVVYSNQLMEHLHPDDALGQLRNIYDSLVPGGCYICITPNRLTGPHDISRYFDKVATGFHLKEYTLAELCRMFSEAGFSKCVSYIGASKYYLRIPLPVQRLMEAAMGMLPHRIRMPVARTPLRGLLGLRLVGIK